MNQVKRCSKCDHSAPSYRPEGDRKTWCFEMRCNVSDEFAKDCVDFEDREEAQLERELAGIVQASHFGL